MLNDKDRVFKNLYNDFGADLLSAKKRGDWINTKDICTKGRDWIINEIKDSQLRTGGLVFAIIGFIIIWSIKN